jgi:transposase-like protein
MGLMSIRATASVLGVSPSTVMRDLKGQRERDGDGADGTIMVGWTQGNDGKWRPDRRFSTRKRDATIRQLYAEGSSMRAIAGAVGCSVGTVHRVVHR